MSKVVVEFTPEEAKLWRAQQKLIAQEKEMEKGYRKVGAAGQAAGKRASKAFGATAVAGLKNYVTGLASIAVATRAAGTAMQFFRSETDRARAGIDTLAASRRALNQIAETPKDLQDLERQADTLAAREGVKREVVRETIFSGKSENFVEFVPKLIEAEGANVITAEAGSTAAGQVPGLFKDSPISSEQAVNALLFAAKNSRLNFEQLTKVLPSAAEGGAQQKADAAETIGIMSVLPSKFKSGETAADRVKALAGRMAIDTEFDLSGKGIIGGVEALQELPEEDRRKFLGTSAELNSAYTAITTEMETIKDRIKGTRDAIRNAGTAQSELTQAITRNLDPTTEIGRLNKSTREATRASIERDIENERVLAETGNAMQAALDRGIAQLDREGTNKFGQAFGQQAGQAGQAVGAQPSLIEDLTKAVGRFASQPFTIDPIGKIRVEIERVVTERMQRDPSVADRVLDGGILSVYARPAESRSETEGRAKPATEPPLSHAAQKAPPSFPVTTTSPPTDDSSYQMGGETIQKRQPGVKYYPDSIPYPPADTSQIDPNKFYENEQQDIERGKTIIERRQSGDGATFNQPGPAQERPQSVAASAQPPQPAPVVNVPAQPAPAVNVAATGSPVVNVPTQPAPAVNVPAAPQPAVNVAAPIQQQPPINVTTTAPAAQQVPVNVITPPQEVAQEQLPEPSFGPGRDLYPDDPFAQYLPHIGISKPVENRRFSEEPTKPARQEPQNNQQSAIDRKAADALAKAAADLSRVAVAMGRGTGMQHTTPPSRRLSVPTAGLSNAQRAQAAVPA